MTFFSKNTWMRSVLLWCVLLSGTSTVSAAWYIYGQSPFSWDVNSGTQLQPTGIGNKFRKVVQLDVNVNYGYTGFVISSQTGSWDNINTDKWGQNSSGNAQVGSSYTMMQSGNDCYLDIHEQGSGYYLFSFDGSSHELFVRKHPGHCYLFGAIASKNIGWDASQGFEMTSTDHITYTATDVVLAAGDNFRFTMTKGTNADDWATANSMTFGPGTAQDLSSGTVQLSEFGVENNFTVTAANAGTYNISVNIETCKVTLTRKITNFYLMQGVTDWNLSTGTEMAISGTTATLSTELDYGQYYFFSSARGASDTDWDGIAPYRLGPATGTVTPESGTEYTASLGNGNSYKVMKGGLWSFNYNLTSNNWTPTLTAATDASELFFVYRTGADGDFEYGNPIAMTRSGNTFSCSKLLLSGDYFVFAVEVGNSWDDCVRYCPSEGGDVTVNTGGSYTASRHGQYAYRVGATGTWTFTYNYLTDEWSATCDPVNVETGELYMLGAVNGNPWQSNAGLRMNKSEKDGKTYFTLENVSIIAGAEFAFASKLGVEDGDWTSLNAYRFGANVEGDNKYNVTSEATDRDHPRNIGLRLRETYDRNFVMMEKGLYTVTVNWTDKTFTITRDYDPLYMYYGDATNGYSHWAADGGVQMNTTDGVTYALSGVVMQAGSTFQFTKELGSAASSWPANNKRIGADNNGGPLTVNKTDLDKVLNSVLKQDSNDAPQDFVMGDDVTAGKFRVVVNLADNSVAVYRMAEVLKSKTIVHLEQNSAVENPIIWAYDKERDKSDENYVHVDRPNRPDFFSTTGDTYDETTNPNPARKVLLDGVEPNGEEITTGDGRKWWTWVLEGSIADFWFTRNGYDYASEKHTAFEHENMTDINWRKAGDIYLTWPNGSNALEEYTRDYYTSAAQEIADCAVMIEGHLYAYFTNTPGWEHVFCHSWYTDSKGVNHDLLKNKYTEGVNWYPGAPCELVGYDSDGYEVYRIDLTAAGVTADTYPVGIIFNNGIDDAGNIMKDYVTGATGDQVTTPKEQTGDFKYSNGAAYDYCGMISLGRSLGNIIAQGVINGPTYVVEDDLVVVYMDTEAETDIEVDNQVHRMYGALYCKDLNKFVTTKYVEKSLQETGQVDYMHTYYNGSSLPLDRYDQSNWVKLVFSTQYKDIATMDKDAQLAFLHNYVGRVLPGGTVEGQLVNNVNPEMRLASIQLPEGLPAYDGLNTNNYGSENNVNVFITCNLVGNQSGTNMVEGAQPKNFFFVTPKPHEYATMTWAVWDGAKFIVPKRQLRDTDGDTYLINGFNLKGSFEVDWDMCTNDGAHIVQTGQAYEFPAIIKLKENGDSPAANGAPRKAPVNSLEIDPSLAVDTDYIVCPLSINGQTGVVTEVTEVRVEPEGDGLYYNLLGQPVNNPAPGIYIHNGRKVVVR